MMIVREIEAYNSPQPISPKAKDERLRPSA